MKGAAYSMQSSAIDILEDWTDVHCAVVFVRKPDVTHDNKGGDELMPCNRTASGTWSRR